MHKPAKEDLARSGIEVHEAKEAEMYSVPDASKVCPDFQAHPALIIPYVDPWTDEYIPYERDGEEVPFCRVRYYPEKKGKQGFTKKKALRYSQPQSSGVHPYFPAVMDWLDIAEDVTVPIMITEGEKKALAACLADIPTIGLGGVYNFTHDGELLPLLEKVEWKGRQVFICYDSDALSNSRIQAAEGRLITELCMKRGADAFLVRLPDLPGGAKQGVDDYLVNHGKKELFNLLRAAPDMGRMNREVLRMNADVAYIKREGLLLDTGKDIWMKKGDFTSGDEYSARILEVPNAKGDKLIKMSVAAEFLTHPHARRYDDTVFVPNTDDKAVKLPGGGVAYNRFRGLSPFGSEVTDEDVDPFFELYDYLMSQTDEFDIDLMWKTICYKIQNLDKKVGLAVMLLGDQGSGKSMFCDIVANMVAPYNKVMSSDELGAPFNGWIETSLICVMNEAKAARMSYNLDTLKRLVTDLRQPCNEKYRQSRQVNSYTFYLFTSNERSAGAFSNDDRRMIVIGCPERHPEGEAFYNRIGDWIADDGSAKLLRYFLDYDLEGWEPPRNAPATREKRAAYVASLSPIQKIGNQIREGRKGNIVVNWIEAALSWAVSEEKETRLAADVSQALPKIQIRPFYTSEELRLLMPLLSEEMRTMSRKHPGDPIMSSLMQQGVKMLKCSDSLDGFLWNGQRRQYLIIADADKWTETLSQDEFEDLMATFPRYGEWKEKLEEKVKAARRKKRKRKS